MQNKHKCFEIELNWYVATAQLGCIQRQSFTIYLVLCVQHSILRPFMSIWLHCFLSAFSVNSHYGSSSFCFFHDGSWHAKSHKRCRFCLKFTLKLSSNSELIGHWQKQQVVGGFFCWLEGLFLCLSHLRDFKTTTVNKFILAPAIYLQIVGKSMSHLVHRIAYFKY